MEIKGTLIDIFPALIIIFGMNFPYIVFGKGKNTYSVANHIFARITRLIVIVDMLIYHIPKLETILIFSVVLLLYTYSDVDKIFGIINSLLYMFLGVFTLFLLNYVNSVVLFEDNNSFWIFYGIVSDIMFFILLHIHELICNSYEIRVKQEKLETQNYLYRTQLKLITQADEDIRKIRHDMKNHMAIIKMHIDDKSYEALDDYLKKINKEAGLDKTLFKTGNHELDAIINSKACEAEKKKINLDCKIFIPNKIGISAFDLAVIFGNLFDNAIRATDESDAENKLIYSEIIYQKGMLSILMTNPCKKDNCLSYSNKGIPKTTKKDIRNHGIGLSNVKKIVNKYAGIMDIQSEDGQFKIELFLFINDEKQEVKAIKKSDGREEKEKNLTKDK